MGSVAVSLENSACWSPETPQHATTPTTVSYAIISISYLNARATLSGGGHDSRGGV